MGRTKQLTNDELKQQVRERTREVQILHRISESISSTLEQETVLKQIVEVVVEVTKADADRNTTGVWIGALMESREHPQCLEAPHSEFVLSALFYHVA